MKYFLFYAVASQIFIVIIIIISEIAGANG